jgi:hypothetical protein
MLLPSEQLFPLTVGSHAVQRVSSGGLASVTLQGAAFLQF